VLRLSRTIIHQPNNAMNMVRHDDERIQLEPRSQRGRALPLLARYLAEPRLLEQ
jgi:hypothetical protein